jgi:hypothetical protein
VGNISQIIDNSAFGVGKVVLYAYDGLNRVIGATTSIASSTSYAESYAYDAAGNLLNKAGTAYAYTGANNADADAPTSIGSTNFAYDLNGNLGTTTATSSALTYLWDWRNRMTQSGGIATSTHAYDQNDARVSQTASGVTTFYPNKYVSITAPTTTDYVYNGNTLLSSVDINGSSTQTRYIHPDLLNSTNMVTNASGTITEALDYLPVWSNPCRVLIDRLRASKASIYWTVHGQHEPLLPQCTLLRNGCELPRRG